MKKNIFIFLVIITSFIGINNVNALSGQYVYRWDNSYEFTPDVDLNNYQWMFHAKTTHNLGRLTLCPLNYQEFTPVSSSNNKYYDTNCIVYDYTFNTHSWAYKGQMTSSLYVLMKEESLYSATLPTYYYSNGVKTKEQNAYFGFITPPVTTANINFYVNNSVDYTTSVTINESITEELYNSFVSRYTQEGYTLKFYTDSAKTTEFNKNNVITGDINIYVDNIQINNGFVCNNDTDIIYQNNKFSFTCYNLKRMLHNSSNEAKEYNYFVYQDYAGGQFVTYLSNQLNNGKINFAAINYYAKTFGNFGSYDSTQFTPDYFNNSTFNLINNNNYNVSTWYSNYVNINDDYFDTPIVSRLNFYLNDELNMTDEVENGFIPEVKINWYKDKYKKVGYNLKFYIDSAKTIEFDFNNQVFVDTNIYIDYELEEESNFDMSIINTYDFDTTKNYGIISRQTEGDIYFALDYKYYGFELHHYDIENQQYVEGDSICAVYYKKVGKWYIYKIDKNLYPSGAVLVLEKQQLIEHVEETGFLSKTTYDIEHFTFGISNNCYLSYTSDLTSVVIKSPDVEEPINTDIDDVQGGAIKDSNSINALNEFKDLVNKNQNNEIFKFNNYIWIELKKRRIYQYFMILIFGSVILFIIRAGHR